MATLSRLGAALLEFLSALGLFTLMLVVFVDVGGRSLLNRPLPWGTELLEVVLAGTIFCMYPVLAGRGNHITVDLIAVRPRLREIQRIVASLVGAALFAVITWCLARQAIRSASYGDASELLQVPTSAVLWCMCGLAAASAVAFLASMARRVRAGRADPIAEPH